MRKEFFEFYRPSEAEFHELWANALIVLDTNALLNLYRTPNNARDEFINVLEILSDQLWIPYQVGLEFHRNRLNVISVKGKVIEDALINANNVFEKVRDDVQKIELDKYGLNIDTAPLLEQLRTSSENLSKAIKSVHDSQIAVATTDTIRESLERLYDGKIGSPPINQAEMTTLVADGERRYIEKIPPGFSDKDKDKNPADATFIHGDIKYERKYGDLIFWRQLIEHTKKTGTKYIILVTADKKEDWWKREEGKTIGPHPELIKEIHREANLNTFWMYSPDQFMTFAAQYANAVITKEAIEEVRDVNRFPPPSLRRPVRRSAVKLDVEDDFEASLATTNPARPSESEAYEFVGRWLLTEYADVESGFFPDFETHLDGNTIGYEVILTETITKLDVQRVQFLAEMTSSAGSMLPRDFFIVIAMPSYSYNQEMAELDKGSRRAIVKQKLASALRGAPAGGIYFGLLMEGKFRPIYYHKGLSEDYVGGLP